MCTVLLSGLQGGTDIKLWKEFSTKSVTDRLFYEEVLEALSTSLLPLSTSLLPLGTSLLPLSTSLLPLNTPIPSPSTAHTPPLPTLPASGVERRHVVQPHLPERPQDREGHVHYQGGSNQEVGHAMTLT